MNLRIAQFLSCRCGVSGVIVLANGQPCGPLCSKEEARQSINDLLREEHIDSWESKVLFEQVMASHLPLLEDDADSDDEALHIFPDGLFSTGEQPEVN